MPTVSLAPQTIAATTNGASLDIRSLVKQGSRFLVVVSIGTLTDGGYTPSVQDSADDSSFAALTPFAGSFVEVTTANDPLTQAVSIVPVTGRPFLRVVITESTAGVTGGPMAAYIIPVPTHV